MSKIESKRILELDSLRGIAAVAVVVYHYTTRYSQLFNPLPGSFFNFPYGAYGVDLFFIVSGFVIFMTLEKANGVRNFLTNRFARLYPTYWVAVIATFLVLTIFVLPPLRVGRINSLINLTMLQSFFSIPNVDGVYWTLEVELIFYACMALILWTKNLTNIRKIGLIALAGAIIFNRFFLSPQDRIYTGNSFLLFLRYLNLFVAGIMFYLVKTQKKSLINILIIFFCLVTQFFVSTILETGIVTGLFLIFFILVNDKLRFINQKLILFLGTISYPLYLIHENIGYVIIHGLSQLKWNYSLIMLATISTILLLAVLIHFLIEIPGQRLFKKILLGKQHP